MKAALQIGGFVSVSAALHVAVALGLAGPGDGAGAPAPVGAEVGLSAPPAGLAALVADWDRAPVTATPVAMRPAATAAGDAPVLPGMQHALPARAAAPLRPATTRADAPPATGTGPVAVLPPPALPGVSPAAPVAPQAGAERPQMAALRGDPGPTRTAPARAGVPRGESVARAGTAPPEPPRLQPPAPRPGSVRAGASGSAAAAPPPPDPARPARDAARDRDLLLAWGGAIRTSIARQKRYPAGTRAEGEAVLRIEVAADGRLTAAALVRSAGDARLDRAALAAVRAARLPRAPEGLSAGAQRFNLPIRFER